MQTIAIIPARYQSTRFPGKPLAKILGKPMIQRVYERVLSSNVFDSVWIATDHREIFDLVNTFCDTVSMTKPDHVSGTDRVWELAQKLDADCVVNVQGDEPLIDCCVLQKIVDALHGGDPVVSAAFSSTNLEWFYSTDHVKVVLDKEKNALYFSRSPIPFLTKDTFRHFWHHVGVYGYSKKSLHSFSILPKSKLEAIEKLEQLRFLENSIKIRIVKTDYNGFGVDRPEDILRAEKEILERGVGYV